MTIRVVLVADDREIGKTEISSTIEVSMADPRWPAWLVDTVAFQAEEGARRLRDELVSQQALVGDRAARRGFVPLAAVVPASDTGR